MMTKIILALLLILAGYQGLKHFGVIGSNTSKEIDKEEKKKSPKSSLNTKNVRGQVKNINSALPQDIQLARRNQLLERFPNVDGVLGSDSAMWLEVLNEEDFTILRELRNKLNLKQDISEDDLKHFVMLENRQVIQAIRENRPALLKGESSSIPDPVQEDISQEEPAYPEPEPEPMVEPEVPMEEAPLPEENNFEPAEVPMDQPVDEGGETQY